MMLGDWGSGRGQTVQEMMVGGGAGGQAVGGDDIGGRPAVVVRVAKAVLVVRVAMGGGCGWGRVGR